MGRVRLAIRHERDPVCRPLAGLRRGSARSTAFSREQGAQWRAHRVQSVEEPLLMMCGESGLLTQGHRHSGAEPRHRAGGSAFAEATEDS